MKKSVFVLSLAASLLMTSCVSKKDLEACQNENKALQTSYADTKEQLSNVNSQLAAANTRVHSLEEQLLEVRSTNATLQKSLDQSLTNAGQNNISIEKLVDQINESNKYIRHLVEVKSKSDSLNMVLSNNLTRSLSKEELKEVDVQGNTDDVPIKRENIRNNWDLSCLRASSVVQALQNDYGVDPKRLTAGGRGEYNPLQPNTTELGKQRNRRTQIIITPKLDEFMDLIGQAPENN